jgi:hypothetical protein
MVAMSSLNDALEILRRQGRRVQTNPGACVLGREMHVPIDGRLRSVSEIYEMVTPPDEDLYGFEAHGKQFEVYIYFLHGEIAYEIHQDGEKLGERQHLDENPLDFVQRTAEKMGGAGSLRRL